MYDYNGFPPFKCTNMKSIMGVLRRQNVQDEEEKGEQPLWYADQQTWYNAASFEVLTFRRTSISNSEIVQCNILSRCTKSRRIYLYVLLGVEPGIRLIWEKKLSLAAANQPHPPKLLLKQDPNC